MEYIKINKLEGGVTQLIPQTFTDYKKVIKILIDMDIYVYACFENSIFIKTKDVAWNEDKFLKILILENKLIN